MTELGRDFFRRDGLTLAEELIGKTLVHRTADGEIACVITETEAYMGVVDRASHAYGGRRTARTETMYLEGGYSYVYLIYGIYSCMNITASVDGNPEAVLIRAAVPVSGLDLIWQNIVKTSRRKNLPASPDSLTTKDWYGFLNGPGKLCRAMDITRADNALDMTGEVLFVRDDGTVPSEILRMPRIGIDYAGEAKDYLYRFVVPCEDGIPVIKMNEK